MQQKFIHPVQLKSKSARVVTNKVMQQKDVRRRSLSFCAMSKVKQTHTELLLVYLFA